MRKKGSRIKKRKNVAFTILAPITIDREKERAREKERERDKERKRERGREGERKEERKVRIVILSSISYSHGEFVRNECISRKPEWLLLQSLFRLIRLSFFLSFFLDLLAWPHTLHSPWGERANERTSWHSFFFPLSFYSFPLSFSFFLLPSSFFPLSSSFFPYSSLYLSPLFPFFLASIFLASLGANRGLDSPPLSAPRGKERKKGAFFTCFKGLDLTF